MSYSNSSFDFVQGASPVYYSKRSNRDPGILIEASVVINNASNGYLDVSAGDFSIKTM